MVQKLIKGGNVAVLYSPGFGAGWSTWSHNDADTEGMIFDAEIAQMVEDKANPTDIAAVAKSKWPDAYLGGLHDLTVEWLPQGTQFEIHEYDGAESVRILKPSDGFTA